MGIHLELICLTIVEALKFVSGLPYTFSTSSAWVDHHLDIVLLHMKRLTLCQELFKFLNIFKTNMLTYSFKSFNIHLVFEIHLVVNYDS